MPLLLQYTRSAAAQLGYHCNNLDPGLIRVLFVGEEGVMLLHLGQQIV